MAEGETVYSEAFSGDDSQTRDRIDPMDIHPVIIAEKMRTRIGGRVELANPVTRRELDLTRNFGVFAAPDALVGPGKFKNSAPANLMMPTRNIDSISLLTRIRVLSTSNQANYSFYSEAGELMATNPEVVEAAIGVLAIHDAALLFESAKPSVLAALGPKEGPSPVTLEPGSIADVLEYDENISGAFRVYLRVAGYPINVDDIENIEGEDVSVEKERRVVRGVEKIGVGVINLGTGRLASTKKETEKQGLLKLNGKELLNHKTTPEELIMWRTKVANRFGENEERVAFALALITGLFNMSPRAKANLPETIGGSELKKEEISNPLVVGQLRSICNSEWVGQEVGTFFDEKNIPKGAKASGTSVSEVIREGSLAAALGDPGEQSHVNLMGTIIESLRRQQPSSLRNWWRRMANLKGQHDQWGWVVKGYSVDGTRWAIGEGAVDYRMRSVLLVSAVDSLVISKETARVIAARVKASDLKYKD